MVNKKSLEKELKKISIKRKISTILGTGLLAAIVWIGGSILTKNDKNFYKLEEQYKQGFLTEEIYQEKKEKLEKDKVYNLLGTLGGAFAGAFSFVGGILHYPIEENKIRRKLGKKNVFVFPALGFERMIENEIYENSKD